MPAAFREADEIQRLTITTQRPLDAANRAHANTTFMFNATEVVGRWNVTVEYARGGNVLEVARIPGVLAPGLWVLDLSPRLLYGQSIIPEPNSVRYFTTSPGARLSGALLIAYED